MGRTLSWLAERLGARLEGDGAREVTGIATLESAASGDLSFFTHPRYAAVAARTGATALLVARHHPELEVDQLVVGDPAAALAEVIEIFHPRPAAVPGVHPTAVVGEGAEIDATAAIGPYAVIGDGARIGARARVGAHAVVGARCDVGDGAILHPHVVLYERVRLGAGAEIHAGTVLGADGFGYASSAAGHRKIPQVGDVEIGAGVEIGALSAVDRALLGTTRIGAGTKIDNLVQVGHNVEIGRAAILCGQAGIAGSAKLGDGVVLGGQAGVGGHLTLGDRAQVASKSAVYEDLAAGTTVAGIPAIPIGKWRRQQSLVRRLEEFWRRLRRLDAATAGERTASGGDEP